MDNEKNNVVELGCGHLPIDMTPPERTLDDYRNDYCYRLAVKLLDELRDNGDITDKEYAKCEHHLRAKYIPIYAALLPDLR
ncbi:MAG: SHOCT domain-containing protein [Bilifractor sp.]